MDMENETIAQSGDTAMGTPRIRRIFQMLSRVNGWSLVVVGGLSFLISVVAVAAAGIIASLALLLHGVYEIVLSKRAEDGCLKSATRKMAFNQLGLAVTLTLYFAYQAIVLDGEALVRRLLASPAYDLLLMYPEDVRIWLIEALPSMVGIFYLLAALVSWLFCGGTAVYYWTHGRKAA